MKAEHLTPKAAEIILNTLPEKIQLGLRAYAAAIDFPIEAVIEMAISGFLDEDAVSFTDCKPISKTSLIQKAG